MLNRLVTLRSVHICFAACLLAKAAHGQIKDDGLAGPDQHEEAPAQRQYLSGSLHGERQRLLECGIQFDFQYVADHLFNIRSLQKTRLASYNRGRGTVNLDLGKLAGARNFYFHITGVWQAGGNLGTYLGALADPSGLASNDTFRLDSYWLERRFLSERLVLRIGQFAGQDSYGAQHDALSFITEPMDYALGNLTATYESFDPPSTPAAELRVIPRKHVYIKSMVFAADRFPYAHNTTGFVPQFRGAASSASEIGWTPGQSATGVRAFDTVQSRTGFTGLYELGATFNPGKFASTRFAAPVSGNYLVYGMVNQAVYRRSRSTDRGLDFTATADWSPADRSRTNQQTTAGLRYNELLPIHCHNTVSLGYVRSGRNYLGQLATLNTQRAAEHTIELNTLIKPTGWLLLQPVLQRFVQVGAHAGNATVFGFRSKVDF